MKQLGHTFTPEGYQQLKDQLSHLVSVKRPKILDFLKESREMGNPEDNLQFEEFKQELELLDMEISRLEEMLEKGSVVKSVSREIAGVGSEVTVEIEGDREVFVLVNPLESNPTAGRISYESPVGKALIDKKKGDRVKVVLPHTEIEYLIIQVK